MHTVADLAWIKGSVAEGQLLISLFSIKPHFLLKLEIDQWVWCCWSICSRDEQWTGLGLDWIRTTTNVVDFGSDPGCKMHQNYRSRTGVKRNFWLAKFLTSHHVRMHRVILYIPNTLIKLIIWD